MLEVSNFQFNINRVKTNVLLRKPSNASRASLDSKEEVSTGSQSKWNDSHSSGDGIQLKPSQNLFKWAKGGCGNEVSQPQNSSNPTPTKLAPALKPRTIGSGRITLSDSNDWNKYESTYKGRDQAGRGEYQRYERPNQRTQHKMYNQRPNQSSYDRPRRDEHRYEERHEKMPEWMDDAPLDTQFEFVDLPSKDNSSSEAHKNVEKRDAKKVAKDVEPVQETIPKPPEQTIEDPFDSQFETLLNESLSQLIQIDDDQADIDNDASQSRFLDKFFRKENNTEVVGPKAGNDLLSRLNAASSRDSNEVSGRENVSKDLEQLLLRANINLRDLQNQKQVPKMNHLYATTVDELECNLKDNMHLNDKHTIQPHGLSYGHEMNKVHAPRPITQASLNKPLNPYRRSPSPSSYQNLMAAQQRSQAMFHNYDEQNIHRQPQPQPHRQAAINAFTPTSVIRQLASSKELEVGRPIIKTQAQNLSPPADHNRMNRDHHLMTQRMGNDSPVAIRGPGSNRYVPAQSINLPYPAMNMRPNNGQTFQQGNIIQGPAVRPQETNPIMVLQQLHMMQQRGVDQQALLRMAQANGINPALYYNAASIRPSLNVGMNQMGQANVGRGPPQSQSQFSPNSMNQGSYTHLYLFILLLMIILSIYPSSASWSKRESITYELANVVERKPSIIQSSISSDSKRCSHS